MAGYSDYRILRNTSIPNLQVAVKQLLATGWVPVGGVAVEGGGVYVQALALPRA